MLGCTNRARAVASIELPWSKYAASVSIRVPRALQQRQVDLLDQVPAGVAVAGQRPLGQQLVAAHRSRRVRPAGGGAVRRQRGAGRDVGAARGPRPTGPTTTGPSPNRSTTDRGRLPGSLDAAEHHDQPVALGRRTARPCPRPAPRGVPRRRRRSRCAGRAPRRARRRRRRAPTQPRALARDSTASSASERSTASTTSASSRASQAPRTSAARA